ncbi:MAG: patatin-like phospholipase family protein [Myxococcales bacterium]|nr:patatin-like phospholipase family protein [Myxococcales bacterium]MCB9525581.1 patatin-like phospholipase family protein [Myxococcales bacterium]
MKTGFVLSGGGSLGAVHVGMLQALVGAGVRPDLVVGTSVGALNGAYFAADPTVEGVTRLDRIWRRLRTRDVFPINLWQAMRAATGLDDHLIDDRGLRALIADHLPIERLEHARVPLRVVATGLESGRELVFGDGPAAERIAASAAIPGIFPPVNVGPEVAVDGGVVNNSPLAVAAREGCDRVIVLTTSLTCRRSRRTPLPALGVALQSLNLLIGRQLINDVRMLRDRVDIRVIPPLCPLPVLPSNFSQSGLLIDQSRALAEDWLAKGGLDEGELPPAWQAEQCLLATCGG